MIKVTELQIGDWVNYRLGWIDEDSGKVVYESGTGFPVRVEFIYNCRGGEGLIQYNDGENDGIEAAEYELFPIPLTPEILEKNGFKNGEFFAELLYKEWQIICDCSHLAMRHEGGWSINIPCNCVHELQHALQLCGIEKEIEI